MVLTLDVSKLNPADILDIAAYAEREAHDQYQQIASWLAARGDEDAEQFFRRMAQFELGHQRRLEELRAKRYGDRPVRYTDAYAWDIESPDYDQLDLDDATLARAIDVAMSAEDQAYGFYADALRYVEDLETRGLLEELRDAELAHKRMLEKKREELRP